MCRSPKKACQRAMNSVEPEIDDVVNPTISTPKALELRHRFKSRLPKAKQWSWIKVHRKSTVQHSQKLRKLWCTSIIPQVCNRQIMSHYRIFSGLFTPNGNFLVTSSQEIRNQVKIYEANRLQSNRTLATTALLKEMTIPDVGWAIIDLTISPDSRYGAVTSWSKNVQMFRINNDSDDLGLETIRIPEYGQSFFYNDHRTAVFSLRYSPGGGKMLGGSNFGRLLKFDLETKKVENDSDKKNENDINAVCYAKYNENLAFAGGDSGIVTCWDMRLYGKHTSGDNGVVGHFAGHSDGVAYIDSAHDGRTILTSAKDQSIKLWDIRKFSSSGDTTRFSQTVQDGSDAWDYRYEYLPSHLQNQDVHVIHGDTSILTLKGHTLLQTLIRAKFSPLYTANRYIYSGDYRGGFCLWDLHSSELNVRRFGNDSLESNRRSNIRSSLVRDVEWHPHLPFMATSSWDGSVSFWTPRSNDDVDEDEKISENESRDNDENINVSRHRISGIEY